jgi:hypothetical protein
MFYDGERPHPPEDATVESLWEEILRLKKLFRPPKKQDVVRALLEDEALVDVPVAVLADVMRLVYEQHKLPCSTSEGSIRWYISQRTLQWDIKQRTKEFL